MDQTARSVNPDFTYWNGVDRNSFLSHDWGNPSREWAASAAIRATLVNTGRLTRPVLVEIGPGGGFDYRQYFRKFVEMGSMVYLGVEGSQSLCDGLRSEFPESPWFNQTLLENPYQGDVVYARHVLEHQPALIPAMNALLAVAPIAFITWYRPPAERAHTDMNGAIHCHTYNREEVLDVLANNRRRVAASTIVPSGRNNGNNFDEIWMVSE